MAKATTKKPQLKVKKVTPDAKLPVRKTEGAACYDIYANEDVIVAPTTTTDVAYQIPTGLMFEIPEGYHVKLFIRSGIGAGTKLRLANQTGIIDSDYRGQVMLLIENVGWASACISKGDRIAQIMLREDLDYDVVEAQEELTKTERGTGGMGSTGSK